MENGIGDTNPKVSIQTHQHNRGISKEKWFGKLPDLLTSSRCQFWTEDHVFWTLSDFLVETRRCLQHDQLSTGKTEN